MRREWIELNESEHARTFAAAELGALERRPRPDELHQPRRRVRVGGGHLVPPPVQREHQPLNHRRRRRRRHGMDGSIAITTPCRHPHRTHPVLLITWWSPLISHLDLLAGPAEKLAS